MNKILSVIIPAYNEEKMIFKAAKKISDILNEALIEYEIIFVDDGSKDNTWSEIISVYNESDDIKGIKLSKNFGKEAAILAGLESSIGECCVIIDCDLQHPPKKIIEMYRLWEDGYEVVEGIKSDRGNEGLFYKYSAKFFYKLISKATDIDMSKSSDFKLLDRKVVNVIIGMKEKDTFFRALSSWVGFTSTTVKFDVKERTEGESKWSKWALIKYAMNNITTFTTFPMQIVTILGGVVFIISIILGLQSLYQKISGQALEGFTTIIIIELFIGSIIMISLGIIGYYISKIYNQIKERPRYIIANKCGKIQVKC